LKKFRLSGFVPVPRFGSELQTTVVGWTAKESKCFSTCKASNLFLLLLSKVRKWNLIMRITSKGQVTIPARIREEAGLLPHMEVAFEYDGESVRIVKSPARQLTGRGAQVLRQLRGSSDVNMSTDEILALTRGS
jgi:AbrB family looped-hinge helix DNA binding protein